MMYCKTAAAIQWTRTVKFEWIIYIINRSIKNAFILFKHMDAIDESNISEYSEHDKILLILKYFTWKIHSIFRATITGRSLPSMDEDQVY